jgi:hypothetical protein
LYRAIRREWTFFSHPAIVDVDHIIRHFPEHRKVALLVVVTGLYAAKSTRARLLLFT